MNEGSPIYEFGEFRLDPKEKRVTNTGGAEVALPPKAFDLLQFMVENSGQLLEKNAILDAVWPESFVEEGNLKINIHLLRKTLGEGLIETVPRRGYRFAAPVNSAGKTEILIERVTEETVTVERMTGSRFPLKYLTAAVVGLVIVAAATLAAFRGFAPVARPASATSVAVLPLRSLSTNKDDEYLGIGFTDALISKLSGLKGLSVRPTSSVLSLAPDQMSASEIRARLGVEKIVEGAIQRAEGRIRISVRLVSTSDGSVLWAEDFDDDESGLLRLQDRIANQIVASMQASLAPGDSELALQKSTSSPAAFDAYLKGRYFWNKRAADDLKKAIGFFEDAKSKDPAFALAYVGISDSYQMLSEYSGAERKAAMVAARENVTKALEINRELGEAHCSLAYLQAFYDWDFSAADASFRRALELSPNYPTAHQWYGEFLLATGRNEESLKALNRARELDPTSAIILTDLVAYYYTTRQFDAAVIEGENVVRIFPKFGFAQSLTALAYLQKGDTQQFYKWAMSADEIYYPPQIVESRRAAYQQGGLAALFKIRYEQSTNPPISLALNDYQRAIDAVSAGDYDGAFGWLEKSVAARDRWVINLNQDPHWDPLRKDPRFDEILKNIKLGGVR